MTLKKVCPKCGFGNDPSEMFCVNIFDGDQCGFSIALTPITSPRAISPDGAEPDAPDTSVASRRCANGHAMDEGDAVCIECGADEAFVAAGREPSGELEPDGLRRSANRPTLFADRYQIVRPLEVVSGEADLFLCERPHDDNQQPSQPIVVKHYRLGIRPNEEVQQKLQTIDSEHCSLPTEVGEYDGRAYEVYDYVDGGTLADVTESVYRQDTFVLAFVDQIATALREIHHAQLQHRDLKPANILMRSIEPPHIMLADFGASAMTELDVHVTTTRRTTRYAAPESFAGVTSFASDWWSVGLIVLELLTGHAAMDGIDDRAFILSIMTRPVVIPEDVSESWRLLLKGLLTRDPALRWGQEQVDAWVAGDESVPHHFEEYAETQPVGAAISLGGRDYHDPTRYALTAAQGDHWDEASSQMVSGELGTWLAEEKIDDSAFQQWKRIGSDYSLTNDERLMLGLLLLNRQLPLCYRGDLVTAASFASTARRSLDWLDNSIPEHLSRFGRELWLVDLSERRKSVQALVKKRKVPVDVNHLNALSLVTDPGELSRQWLTRQSDFPEARHPVLVHLTSRQSLTDVETVVLLAAPMDEFRSADEVIGEANEESMRAGLQEFFDSSNAKGLLRHGRSHVYRSLSELISDFVRCGISTADQWADTFRFDHRITLTRAIVLLCIPPDRWVRPKGGEHWRLLLKFFRRKVLSSVQRGPLMSLRIGKNTARIDVAELGSETFPAEGLVNAILSREANPQRVDPGLLAADALLQRRLRRLRNNSENYQRDTGISSLYLGFPFLVRRDRAAGQSTPRFIPLLLWPVRLHYPDGQNTSLRIGADHNQERVRLNPAFGLSLSESQRNEFTSVLTDIQTRDSITSPQLIEILQPLFNASEDDVRDEFSALPGEPRLPSSVDRRLIASGVVFQCDFAGQELADELERLQKLPFTHSPAATLLRLKEPSIVDLPCPPSADGRFLVSSADPSQETAVYAARTPPGLLIQGPPGTGKSQTIVNIVADAVARGKTVLVVCQKQAALEVVCHRLQAEGLGDRTAMIADPSKDRRPFLERLRNELGNLNAHGDRDTAFALNAAKANEVTRLEHEIDSVHEAMTELVASSGLSYEQVLSELIEVENSDQAFPLSTIREMLLPLQMAEVAGVAKQIQHHAPLWLQSKYEGSALHALKPFSPDRETITTLKQKFDSFVQCEHSRRQEIESGKSTIDINRNDMPSIAGWLSNNETSLAATPDAILKIMKVWVELFENGIADGELHQLEAIAAAAEANVAPDDEIRLRTKLTELDDRQIKSLYRDCQRVFKMRKSFLRAIWPPYRSSRRRIAEALEIDVAQVREEVEFTLAVLKYESKSRASCRDFERSRNSLKLRSPTVNLPSEQLAQKSCSLIATLRIAKSLMDRGRTCPQATAYYERLKSGQPESFHSFLNSLRQGVVLYALRDRSLKQLGLLDPWMEMSWIEQVEKAIQGGNATTVWTDRVLSAWDTLAAFQTFRLRSASIPEMERSILVAMSEVRDDLDAVTIDEAANRMSQTVCREALCAWRARAEQQSPCLLIERDEFDAKVKWLRQSCREHGDTVRSLIPRLPNPERIARRNRWDDIVMYTGPRAKKLRETVDMGKDFGLYQLRPIWLANPDTVSRIFPLQEGLFDVVVFDEASQLPVEYALPAIYRGKTIVVSGDEKQLPPAKFFAAAFEDDDDELSDLEGNELEQEILSRSNRREVKDCTDLLELASPVFPSVMLNVHYRSRYRQLIDFSNSAYYENRLSVPVLHPLEKVSEFKPIQFIEVDGVYDDQSNETEAQKVVKTLHKFWSSNSVNRSPTIGVVTFNLKQAELIEDKLEELAENDEDFRRSLRQQRDREKDGERCGFFVKNVENVQGDERDYMIFSTTFGRNPSGTFRRNFGVLGQRGGERRLNVATTRAKKRMVIFSSMPLERISDVRQSLVAPQTPRDFLQAYLMYAKAISDSRFDDAKRILAAFGNSKGRSGRGDESSSTGLVASSTTWPFVLEVQKFLQQHGWEVERPLATDAFKFDLAIRRPKDGMFAIAINCDSPRHRDLRFARHRELWRADVLRSTVPVIHRVWSRMWLVDSENEKQRLLDAVKKAMGI